MAEDVILVGAKFKVYFVKPINSLKLLAEAEEKIVGKCKYHTKYAVDELLSFEKVKNNLEYKISLKPDHLAFYSNATNENLNKVIQEFKNVLTIFREVMYNYIGNKPEIKNIVYTKGYSVTNDEFVDYIQSLNYRLNKNGVSSSISYGGQEKMNFLLRKYFIDDEYTKNYLNNIEKYTQLLL